jgi:beta-1,4-mannosyltransferase
LTTTMDPARPTEWIAATWPGQTVRNPFVQILTDGLASAGLELRPISRPSQMLIPEASALLIQWPDQIFWHATGTLDLIQRAAREILGLWRWRRSGKTLIWVVHNAVPHDRSRTERRIWAAYTHMLARLVHGYMTLSPATRDAVLKAHPGLRGKPFAWFRHPAYRDVLREESVASDTREKLGVRPGQVLISAIGMLRAYKGIDELLTVFGQAARNDWRLLIAGRPGMRSLYDEIQRRVAGHPSVIMDVHELSDDELANYVAASDRLVAPYKDYLHSGSLIYAVSAARMVLTPSTPFARDLSDLVGAGWVNTYNPPLTPADLRSFMERSLPATPPDISSLKPSKAGRDIVDFIERLRR